jgi:rhodanese-related sulfurtransferase
VEDESAAGLAARLIADGYDPGRVFVLKDGLAAWEEEGLPLERTPP